MNLKAYAIGKKKLNKCKAHLYRSEVYANVGCGQQNQNFERKTKLSNGLAGFLQRICEIIVNQGNQTCQIFHIKRRVDYEWLEGYLDNLYPTVDVKKKCKDELLALKRAMGGREFDIEWPASLVLATKR